MQDRERKPLDWEALFRRYVWDNERTPYGTPVAELNRRQADYELHAFCLFTAVLFGVVCFVALSGVGPFGRSPSVSMYAFSIVCAATVLGFLKLPWAAWYLGSAPALAILFCLAQAWTGARAWVDTFLVLAVLAVLLVYSVRVVAIARSYASLPEASTPARSRRDRSMF